MAAKQKAGLPPEEEDEIGDEDEAKPAPGKGGLPGRILALPFGLLARANPLALLKLPRRLQLILGAALLALLAGGAGFVLLAGGGAGEEAKADPAEDIRTEPPRLPPETAAFFPIPDIIVNIQSPDPAPAYLKLSVSLELESAQAQAAVEPVLPRIIDQFQAYLRELRVEDIRGSAGVMRLKEELLRRVNLAAAPTPVRDVLLREMIVQ